MTAAPALQAASQMFECVHASVFESVCREWFIESHSFETNVNMKQEKKDANIPHSKSMQVLFWGALAILLFIISTLSILPSLIFASLSYLFSIKY